MSLPTVELVVGRLRDGVSTTHPSFKKLRDACVIGGLPKQVYGVAVEDSQMLYWLIHYDTIEPKDFLPKWPSDFCDYFKEIKEITTEEPVSFYMPRDSYAVLFPQKSTSVPITEIVVLELKSEADIDKYKTAQQAVVDAQSKEPTAHAPWFSMIKSDKGVSTGLVFVGWDSKEAHEAWAAKHGALLQPLRDVAANATIVHVPFREHTTSVGSSRLRPVPNPLAIKDLAKAINTNTNAYAATHFICTNPRVSFESPEMSTHPVELLIITVKAEITSDSAAFTVFREEASKTDDAVVRQAYGFQVNDPARLYWLRQFREGTSPEAFGSFAQSKAVLDISASEAIVHNLHFKELPNEVFTAPVTEISTVTLKQEINPDEFTAYRASLTTILLQSPVFRGLARGVPEADRTTWTLLGWESIEGHHAWAKEHMGTTLEYFVKSVEKSAAVHVSWSVL
ncbi:uncharacterized protein C8Q71DRAFT_863540 [Rhodofomes roseus]|uniref:ABM domain-containing protein n=1 Tax=Rhodofomes roseus TaxID=34475 RepID=A0ABQ8JYD3_9APHY|nr:uncharacterized protein C8Q71DRAFT_863540 [Rhodofomes roseus]KAH9829097.1 hypothetical protein C8Q71DRAFT_863540 [Rhodofomes roseus]